MSMLLSLAHIPTPDVLHGGQYLVGITMRKKGIADKAYLAPLTVDDNRK